MNWFNNLKKLERASRELLGLARLAGQTALPGQADKDAQAEAMEQLWQKREKLAVDIQTLSRLLQPVWQSWPQCLQPLSQEQAEQVGLWLRNVRQNIGKILELDKHTKVEMERMLEETRLEMLEINHKSQALRAYKPKVLTNSRHCLPAQLSRTT